MDIRNWYLICKQKSKNNNNILASRKGTGDYPENFLDTENLVSKDPYICSVTLI